VALQLDQQPGDLRLRAWSRVEGRLMRANQPVVGETIYLHPIRMLGGENPHVQDSFTAITDGTGRFVFDRAPPLPSNVHPYVSVWRETKLTSSEHVPLNLQPGETSVVQLGADGIVVRGRVRPSGELAPKLDMNYCLNYLLKRTAGIDPPSPIARAGFDWRNGWSFDLTNSQEGRGFLSTLFHHFVKFQSDGTFAIHGVTPGDYQFAISVYEPPEGCLVDPVGLKVVEFKVTEADEERGELDLGMIDVEVKLGPQVGEPFPTFRYGIPSSDEVHSVSDWRGRYVLVDFWATWCGPCIAHLPELGAVAKRLDPKRATVLSICLDEDLEQAKAFMATKEMDWPRGLLGERDNPLVRQQLGVSSVPICFVLDPEGKLVHRSFRLDEAVAALYAALEGKQPEP
jgi:thiol-disulfide isomerase/thioredoxin